MARRFRACGTFLTLALALAAAGCAASAALRHGREAERLQDYDRAVVEYTKAVRLDPDNLDARLALDRAKLRASQDHYARGRRLAATGKFNEALIEYETAAELNPTNADVERELRATRNKLRARIAVHQEGKTELQTLIERARDLPPPGLDLPQGVKMPDTLTFRDASSRDVFTAISRLANISLIFDPLFREMPITVDLRNASLEDALNTVAGATRTFFRVTAPRTITVIPDTPGKAARVRRRSRPDVLSQQRRSQRDDGPAADGARRSTDLADDRYERADDQGHAGANQRGRPRHLRHRQGPSGSDHRRRAARSRPHQVAGIRPPDRIRPRRGLGRTGCRDRRFCRRRSGPELRDHAPEAEEPLAGRRAVRQPAIAVLPSAENRRPQPDAGESTAPDVGRLAGAGALRRAGAGAEHDVRADRDGRHAPAADRCRSSIRTSA